MCNTVIDCSIIIVTYNAKEYFKKCIDSIYKYTQDVSFEIIVSDNASTDGLIPMIRSQYKDIIIIENKRNIGFGAANNKGLEIAKGKYIFYLNEDTELKNNAIKMFIDYYNANSGARIGALGAYLKSADGRINGPSGNFPTYGNLLMQMFLHNINDFIYVINEKVGRFRVDEIVKRGIKNRIKDESSKEQTVDYICGADLFMKNDDNAKFDERYFLYFEETDLQLRLSEQKMNRVLIPGPYIIHYGGGTQDSYRTIKPIFDYQISAVKYAKKNLNTKARLLKRIILLNWQNKYLKEKVNDKNLINILNQL